MKKLQIKLLDSYPEDMINRDLLPRRSNKHDAGIDLVFVHATQETVGNIFTFHTGTSVNIPEGYVGLLFMRSSVYKKSIRFANAVGVIDAGYTGEIKAKVEITHKAIDRYDVSDATYYPGDYFAQLVIVPVETPELEFVSKFTNVAGNRGSKGFGSSGN